MPSLIWQTLYGRGLRSVEDIESLFSPRLKDLTTPVKIHDMEKAVERLCRAYENSETVCIYADFDLDGTSGLALLKKGLEWLGFQKLCHFQPRRLVDGYGFHSHVVDALKDQAVNLIVTVDVGITAVEGVQRANQMGMDVIITDHHLPKSELPPALAVVNPNKGHCPSNLGHLCGAGVAFYLFLALRKEFMQRGWLKTDLDPKGLLDCFVVGTLTDMVPLVKENRVLVKHGLIELAKTRRPGLRALLEALNLWGRPLTSQEVAIRFAPKLNALSRMEMGILPIDLFLIEDEIAAQEMVSEVISNNERRVNLQSEAEQIAVEIVEKAPSRPFIWLWSEKFHKGVIGLVATRLSQKYSVPAFVGSVHSNGQITGSARAPAGSLSLLDALGFGSNCLVKYGGHAPAAGFELELGQAENFGRALEGFFSEMQWEEAKASCHSYDAQGECLDIDETFMKWFEAMGPFGVQFETPVYLLQGLRIKSVRWLKGQHIKLSVSGRGGGRSYDALWFSPPAEHPLSSDLGPDQLIDALVEPQWNHYNGRKSLQLIVRDLRKTSP